MAGAGGVGAVIASSLLLSSEAQRNSPLHTGVQPNSLHTGVQQWLSCPLSPPVCAEADAAWAQFIARLWPVAHRYRVLLALRRGEYGEAIHGLLGPVDELLAGLVERGQGSGVFARHLPAGILSQVAYGVVFAIADSGRPDGTPGARAATITSLLLLGVPESRATALAGGQP